MAFEDLGDWAELTGLRLPIGGKTYILPPVGAELGIRIVAIMDLGRDLKHGNDPSADDQELLSDADERSLYKEILGPAWDEMVADNVPWPALKHAAVTAMIDVSADRATAEAFWASLGKAKKTVKKPADRQPRKATANRTTKVSTAGTTRRQPRKAAVPRGARSSRSGA